MTLSADTRARARQIVARYPRSRSALLPMLHLVQSEEGYVSSEGIALCADELGLTKAEVGAVATFYTMYKRRPAGDWLVSVCTNISCQLLGAEDVFACLSRHLGVGHDETTPDGTITLEHAECLAACDYAPVLTVNYEFFDNVTPDRALEVVQALQRGERPAPTRGDALVTFREMSEQLAGFVPDQAVRATADQTAPGHPAPPTPVDSRGAAPAAPAPAGYAVPGGVTEGRLSDEAAAATYGTGATADAGPPATDPQSAGDAAPSPSGRSLNNPATAGHLTEPTEGSDAAPTPEDGAD